MAAACAPAVRVAAEVAAAAAVAVKEGGGQWGSDGELVEGASGEEEPAQGGKSHKSSLPSHSVPHIAAARQSRSRPP